MGVSAKMGLTDVQVRSAKPADSAQKLWDEKGLFLHVTPKGAKSWRWKYRYAGKEKLLTFGLYPEVNLKAARAERDKARSVLRENKDPAVEAEKRRQAAIAAAGATFKSVAETWMTDEAPRWSPGHQGRVRHRIERDIYPAFGKLPVADIDGPMILRALRAIERRGSIETAKRVRGYVEAIFRRAKGDHLVDKNPATADEIGAALKPTPHGSKQPALTMFPQLLELQQAVDRSTANPATKLCSRLLALTVVRVGVLRTATWGEFDGIDWDNPDAAAPDAIWRISASRMKLEVEDKGNEAFGHEVPLAPQAVEALRALRPISGRYDLLFPSDKTWREPMSDAAVSTLYKRMAGGVYKGRHVPHGWRSAFSTLMNERAAEMERDGDRMLIDMILAHVPKGMSASEWAYNRARYLKPRRQLHQAWADLISEGLAPAAALLKGQHG